MQCQSLEQQKPMIDACPAAKPAIRLKTKPPPRKNRGGGE
jgi:hypothetical protein